MMNSSNREVACRLLSFSSQYSAGCLLQESSSFLVVLVLFPLSRCRRRKRGLAMEEFVSASVHHRRSMSRARCSISASSSSSSSSFVSLRILRRRQYPLVLRSDGRRPHPSCPSLSGCCCCWINQSVISVRCHCC